MKKHVFGRQFNRDINERKALFKGLVNSLVMEESITTTEPKAKAIKGQVEKLITKAKNRGPQAKPFLQPWLQAKALEKVMSDLSVRFATRPGGYTRIIKLGERFGDNASMAVIEFVEKKEVVKATVSKEAKGSKISKEKVEARVRSASSGQKKAAAKKEQPNKKEQRPPSKSEMEGRSAGKGSPKKESK